jgi:hypothetical protein
VVLAVTPLGAARVEAPWDETPALRGSPPEASVGFVRGMMAMVDDVKATLSRAGVPSPRIHLNF